MTARVAALFIDLFISILPVFREVDPGLLLSLLFFIGYMPLVTAVTGTTLGKRLLGLRVVDSASFDKLPAGRAVRREFMVYLSILLFYIPFLTALDNSERQTWYDHSTRSRVVRG